jgi:hypothetical protein
MRVLGFTSMPNQSVGRQIGKNVDVNRQLELWLLIAGASSYVHVKTKPSSSAGIEVVFMFAQAHCLW